MMHHEHKVDELLEDWLNQPNAHKKVVNFLVEWLLADKYFTMGGLTENNKHKLIDMLNGDKE